MPAYIVAINRINDPDVFAEYLEAGRASMAGFDGLRVVGSSNPVEVLDGVAPHPRCVVLEFPDMETARAWYHSPAYQAAAQKRFAASDGFVILVDGVTPS